MGLTPRNCQSPRQERASALLGFPCRSQRLAARQQERLRHTDGEVGARTAQALALVGFMTLQHD